MIFKPKLLVIRRSNHIGCVLYTLRSRADHQAVVVTDDPDQILRGKTGVISPLLR